jgi:hypothetical protein
MLVNIGCDIPLNNMWGWEGIQEKAREVNSMKAYVKNGATSC